MLRTLLAAAVLLLLAACNAAPGATPSSTPGPPTVALSAGGFFVGPNGMSLYTFDNDTLGHSVCEADCLENWPTLNVGSTPEITVGPGLDLAEYTAITRDDGGVQVTYKLIPLYYFAGDHAIGETNGDGVGDAWHLAKPGSTLPTPAPATPAAITPGVTTNPDATCDPAYDDCDKYTPKPTAAATPAATPAATAEATSAPTPAASPAAVEINLSEDGQYLVDAAGFSLYTFDNDTEELVSTCVDTCAENWPPLLVPEGATIVPGEGVEGEFVAFARPEPEDAMQVAMGTTPLYLYVGDTEPGQRNGDGVNDVWHLASAVPVVNPL